MGFITQDDYNALIKDAVLAQVMDNDRAVVNDAELFAQQELESYLNQRFDVASIFSQTGTARNSLLVMYMMDCVLYHIHARINPSRMPEIRVTRYEKAIKWLEMVASGKLTPNLPKILDPDTGGVAESTNKNRFGSNPKFNHQF